jgi:hypothetical protein
MLSLGLALGGDVIELVVRSNIPCPNHSLVMLLKNYVGSKKYTNLGAISLN